MELKIMNLFSRTSGCSVKPAAFAESGEDVPNPGRGWYRVFSMDASKNAPLCEWKYAFGEGETLALLMVDIGAYRECNISEEALSRILEAFSFFREENKELLLRIVYDREGKGMEREPKRLSVVLQHMEQLAPLLLKNKDILYVIQGLFVGNWGEMHGSRYLTKEALTTLYKKQRELLGEDIFLAVRRPDQWKTICRGSKERLCLFNDGLLGSDTDLGTYPKEERQENIAWMGDIGLLAPNSGEAVGQEPLADARHAEAYFRSIRLACLNGTYDPRVLDALKAGTLCGENAFDYIGKHLGYRFLVTDACITKKDGKQFVAVTIENRGFSPIFEECGMYLTAEGCGGRISPCGSADLRTVIPGERLAVLFPTEQLGTGILTLFVYRRRDHRPIVLANAGAGEGVTIGSFCNER